MSVAFRRESDEEHLEPKFELPIPAGPNFVTPAGLAQIEARVAELEAAVEAASDEEQALTITGHDEADPTHGRIAFSAPLARALMGSGEGDLAEYAGEEDAIEVIEVGTA